MPDVSSSDATNVRALLADADDARSRGDLVTALRHYNQVSQISPSNTYAQYWLATCHETAGNLPLAHEHCTVGLRIDPTQIGLLLRLGSIAMAAHDHKLALTTYLRAAELDPDIPDIDSMIGDQYCMLGQISAGVERFERALQRDPQSTRLQSNRLFVLNYANLLTPDELFQEHRRWGATHETALSEHRQPHANSRDPERILRIGYVSGDLRDHAISFFVEPLLAHHDKDRVEVVCFDVSRYADDTVSSASQELSGIAGVVLVTSTTMRSPKRSAANASTSWLICRATPI